MVRHVERIAVFVRVFTRLSLLVLGVGGLMGVMPAVPAPQMEETPSRTQMRMQEGGKPAQAYSYQSMNRRDPFIPLLNVPQPSRPRPLVKHSEKVPENWRIIGIMSGKIGVRAILGNREGETYLVKPGQRIGSGGWKVRDIHEQSLILEKVGVRQTGDPSQTQKLIIRR